MSHILVTGASGAQGRAVARQLIEAGHAVRLFVRDPSRVADLATLGAEVVQRDHVDTAAVAKTMRGQDGPSRSRRSPGDVRRPSNPCR